MSADFIYNRDNRASFWKRSFSALYASIFRPNYYKRRWEVLSLTALYIFILGLLQFLELGAVNAKESQDELGPYEVIVRKDPFDPERGKSQPLTSADEGDLKDQYQVYGTIIAGEMRQAFLMVATSESTSSSRYKKVANGSQKALRTVSVGDIVDGWRVADITAQGIKFESDGEYVEVSIFEAKKERKATAPVALQTPIPKVEVSQEPQSTTAKRPSSIKPGSVSQKEPVQKTSPHSRKPANEESQAITGDTGGDKHISDAPSNHPLLEIIKKAKDN
jgi:hypothetical protein